MYREKKWKKWAAIAVAALLVGSGLLCVTRAPMGFMDSTLRVSSRLAELRRADAYVASSLLHLSDPHADADRVRQARGTIDSLSDLLGTPPTWLDDDLSRDYRAAFDEFLEIHHTREQVLARLDAARRRGDGGDVARLASEAANMSSSAALARVEAVLGRHAARTARTFQWTLWIVVAVSMLGALVLLVSGGMGARVIGQGDIESWWAGALEPMLLLDERGRLVSFNPAAQARFGLARAGDEGADVAARLVDEESLETWRERLARVLETRDLAQATLDPEEIRVRLEDGESAPAEFAMAPIVVGGRHRVLVHVRDRSAETSVEQLQETLRTSTKQLTEKELELQITQARKAAIFSASLDCIVGLDADWHVIEWNPATMETFGYNEEELDNLSLPDMVGPPASGSSCDGMGTQARETSLEKAVEVIEVGQRVETCARRRDGSTFPAEVSVVRVEAAGPPLFTAYIVDITERKNVERIKNEFISIVSHELRTPLTSIRGSLGLLEGGVAGRLEGAARELVHIARSNSDRLIRLINDMLDLEKMQSGKDELVIEPVAPRELIASARASVQGMAEEAGVTIVEEVACERPVMGDRDRLVQVVTNLLSNAVKASPEGGEVLVRAAEGPDGRLRIAVTDQGEGIPEDQIPYLFDRFKRVSTPVFRKKHGTGLGLAISKTIMTQHHGTIEVESRLGRGATFTMVVPVAGE